MKRTLLVVLALGLVAGSLAAPADAKKKKKKPVARTMELRYENPTVGASVGPAWGGVCSGCPSFSTGPDESYVQVEIIDDASPVGHIVLAWDTDGDDISDTGEEICGKTETAISVPPGGTINIFPFANPNAGCVGASTSGTVKVTISSVP